MTLNFYRINSDRGDEAAAGSVAEAMSRESYGCAERGDCALFLWRDAAGEPRMLQFLFGEDFIEWRHGGAWRAGSTNRAQQAPAASGRGKGVRTLHGRSMEAADAILLQGLALLTGARLPSALADIIAHAGHV